MEVEQIDVVSRCFGAALTPQERSNLEIGLLKRRATESLVGIRFWGKILGESADYLIVRALLPIVKGYPSKKFYFSTNLSPELQQFPQLTTTKRDKAAKMSHLRFKGDPALLLEEVDPAAAPPADAANPDATASTPFCELDRLVYTVQEIDHATSVVPIQAFVVSPTRSVIANASFHGLSRDQAHQLANYFHFRQPDQPEKARVLTMDGLVRPGDFFESLMQDLEGTWTISEDNSGAYIVLRNYMYPGAVFFHEPETSRYGSVYFGDGRKNADFAFMM